MSKRRNQRYEQTRQYQPGKKRSCGPCEPLCILGLDHSLKAGLYQVSEDMSPVQWHRRKAVEEAGIEIDPAYPEQQVRYPEELATQGFRPSAGLKDRGQPAAKAREPFWVNPGIPAKGRLSI